MLSSIVLSLFSLTPLAFASPIPLLLSKRGEIVGGFSSGLGYGNGLGLAGALFGGGGRERFDLNRLRLDKDDQLLAAERNDHLNFDKDTDLDAKNYKESNFDAEKDRAFDNSDLNRKKLVDLAKEQALRKNLELGGGGFEGLWKRQVDDEDDGFDFNDFDEFSPTTTTTTTSTLPQDGSASSPDSTPEGDTSTDSIPTPTPQDDASSPQDTEDDFGSDDEDSTLPSSDLSTADSSTPSDFTPDTSAIEDYEPTSSPTDSASLDSPSTDASTSSPSRSNDVEPTQTLRRRQLDDFDLEDLDLDDEDDEGSFILKKRSLGFEGVVGLENGFGGFGEDRFHKNVAFNVDKLLRLAEFENARRRKALDLAKVRFNTKDFNDLEFNNDVHLNRDGDAKEIALADRDNLDTARISKVGGFW